jgi:hypothetical protein
MNPMEDQVVHDRWAQLGYESLLSEEIDVLGHCRKFLKGNE